MNHRRNDSAPAATGDAGNNSIQRTANCPELTGRPVGEYAENPHTKMSILYGPFENGASHGYVLSIWTQGTAYPARTKITSTTATTLEMRSLSHGITLVLHKYKAHSHITIFSEGRRVVTNSELRTFASRLSSSTYVDTIRDHLMRNSEGDGERNLQSGFIETSFLVTKKREIGVSLIDSRAVVAVMPIGLSSIDQKIGA